MQRFLALVLMLALGSCGGEVLDEAACEGPDCECEGEGCVTLAEGCLLVAEEGTCTGLFTLARCVSREGEAEVVEERCSSGEICERTPEGASCQPLPPSCQGDVGYCASDGVARRCVGGSWVDEPCQDRCSESAVGPRCWSRPPGTRLHRARILYEHHAPAEDRKGWKIEARPAAGLQVYSYSGDSVLHSTRVEDDGSFEIFIHENPKPEDSLMIAAFDRVFGQGSGRYSVLNPRLSPGVHDPVPKGDAIPWVWEIANVAAEEHLIRESHGSGAIQIFQALRRAVDHLAGIRIAPLSLRSTSPELQIGSGANVEAKLVFISSIRVREERIHVCDVLGHHDRLRQSREASGSDSRPERRGRGQTGPCKR